MELKKSNYEIEIKKGAMKLFEEKVLFSGMCDFVIPMRFTDAGESRKITYDCSGCVALRDMYPLSTGEIFEILEKTLLTLNRSVEFFIPHEKVKIDKDTVYYDMKRKKVRIAYMPIEGASLKENLEEFIDELSQGAGEETVEYLMSVKDDLDRYNRNLKEVAGFVAEQRKRIHQCGIR